MTGDEQALETAGQAAELTARATELRVRAVEGSLVVKAVLGDGSFEVRMLPEREELDEPEEPVEPSHPTSELAPAAPVSSSQLAEDAQWLTSRVLRVGAGLGGLVIFGDLARDAFSENHATRILRAVFVVLVLAAGSLLGFAWARAAQASSTQQPDSLAAAQTHYHWALVITALAGIALVIAAIWSAV